MKTSYSQSDTYKSCSQHWHFKYKDKIETNDSGASTFFGSAVDEAIGTLLKDPSINFYQVFKDKWQTTRDRKGNTVSIFDNDLINFAHSDFDKDVINNFFDEVKDEIEKWMQELNIPGFPDFESAYALASKAKKNPYKRIPQNQLKLFNRLSWLSLYYKGLLMLESFEKQFYPKIEQVVAVQKHAHIKDESTGDSISGVIDMVLKLKDYDRNIIFDLKTAARPYTQEQIDHSEQLTIYLAMEGQRYNTDTVGYVVLPKAINKEVVAHCKSCGYKKDGRHKTCNNVLPEKLTLDPIDDRTSMQRCNGEWLETVVLKPEVQVLIQRKSDAQVSKVLDDQSNIIVGMKNNVVFKNLSKCENWFGNKCPYYNLCHKDSSAGLTKKD